MRVWRGTTCLSVFIAALIPVGTVAGDLGASIKGYVKDGMQEAFVDHADWRKNVEHFKKQQQSLAAAPNPVILDEMQKMALSGHPGAMNFIGWLLDNGKGGVPRNSYRAAQYFRAAAEKGDMDALYNLSILLYEGRGVTANKGMADAMLKRAANEKHKFASVRMALLLEQQNKYQDAQRYYEAAISGVASHDTIHDLAIYRRGLLSFREASNKSQREIRNGLALITRAAKLWNPDAQATLVEVYSNGLSVPRDAVEAGKWAEALRNNPRRPTRPFVAPAMTDKESVAALKAYEIWAKYHPVPSVNTPQVRYDIIIF